MTWFFFMYSSNFLSFFLYIISYFFLLFFCVFFCIIYSFIFISFFSSFFLYIISFFFFVLHTTCYFLLWINSFSFLFSFCLLFFLSFFLFSFFNYMNNKYTWCINKLPDFFCTGIKTCRWLWKIQYVIAIHLMRWLINFYDFRFKWTATAAIGINPMKD